MLYYAAPRLYFLQFSRKLRLKTTGFLYFYGVFILSPFPRSPYFCTAVARQPTISALNQASPFFYSQMLSRGEKRGKSRRIRVSRKSSDKLLIALRTLPHTPGGAVRRERRRIWKCGKPIDLLSSD